MVVTTNLNNLMVMTTDLLLIYFQISSPMQNTLDLLIEKN